MTSEFVYGNQTKKVKASVLKPEILSRLFKLDEDSLVLTDENGECYMPSGSGFEPPLPDGMRFEVDGTEKGAVSGQLVVIPQAQRDLAVIQGVKRDAIITDVIQSCQNMNESANMLYHGPQAVFIVQSLAILSVCAPDPSLVTKAMTVDKFKRLKTPESFRASLYQVASNMCGAFRTADYSMNTIRASLIDLPDYFEATLDVIDQVEDPKTKKVMDKTIQKIENASAKCKEAADNAQKAFSDVLLDIDELCQASITTKTTSARELEEMKKLQVELKLKEKQREVELKHQEEVYEKAKEQAATALKDYREQIKNSGTMGKLFLATLTDGLFDTVKDMKDVAMTSVHKVAEAVSDSVHAITSHIPLVGTDKENGILKTLETIHINLGQLDNLENETIDEYIAALKEYQKYSPATEEGKELFKKANDLKKFLEDKHKYMKDPAHKQEITKMRAGVLIVIEMAAKSRQERKETQERKEHAANSLCEQLIKADTEKTNITRDHYNKQSDKEDQLRKELSKNHEELTNIMCRLQNIDMTKVELTDVIKCLREGIDYLGRVKENWQKLSHFFDSIKIIVDNNLSENIKTFVENAKEDISRKLMLQAALKATSYCIQISNCAAVYTIVSQKYVMPVISGIGKQFALTPGEAIKKQSEIGRDLDKIMVEVKALIEQKQEEYRARAEENIIVHADNLVKAISGSSNKALEDK